MEKITGFFKAFRDHLLNPFFLSFLLPWPIRNWQLRQQYYKQRIRGKNMLALGLFLSVYSLQSRAAIVYVDSAHIGGTQNGISWATAFSNFQSGINAAHAGDSVWVAKGTYQPVIHTAFTMKDSVMIFGGFRNTHTTFTDRNIQDNVTILKGNDSSVIVNRFVTPKMLYATAIDGFTITEGLSTGSGGGMYNDFASPVISNCIFVNNASSIWGGGLCSSHCTTRVRNCSFYNNTSSSGGGMVTYWHIGEPLSDTIENCRFVNNEAINGGALESSYNLTKIIGCFFSGNTADVGGAAMAYGDFYDCIFSNNSATGFGGAIYTGYDSTKVIKNCIFLKNSAVTGGAIKVAYSDSVLITDCTFSGNKAAVGGAFFNGTCSTIFSHCLFLKDTAYLYGGAIHNENAIAHINNCLFDRNVSDSIGAAIYNYYYSNVIKPEVNIFNSTIVNNRKNAIYNAPATKMRISNSIVWNNGIVIEDTSALCSITYSLVQDEPASVANHNLDGSTNPLFTDMTNGQYQLQCNSPCINAGNNDSIPTGTMADLAGNNRIWSNTVDMGAYEYFFAVNLGNDSTICSGNAVTLNAQNQGSSYLWNNGSTTQSIAVNASGEYYVAVTNAWGTLTDTIHVEVIPSPVVMLGNDTAIGQGAAITLNAGNTGATYLWNTGAATQTVTISAAGTYDVVVTNNAGCSSTDTIVVAVNPLGLNGAGISPDTITISPNPARETIRINITDLRLLHTKGMLTDAYGRLIRAVSIESKSQEISLTGLAYGIYILKMENGTAAKIVKEW